MISRSESRVCVGRSTEEALPSAPKVGARPVRIWLVDDNDSFRGLLAELLKGEAGIECSGEFPSAEAVLDALGREVPPDVILLDIDMGGMSGLDALAPIRALAGATRVLMLTAFYDSQREERARREGAADFLLKSYSLARICNQIRRVREDSESTAADLSPEEARPSEAGRVRAAARDPSIWPNRRAPVFRGGRFSRRGVKRGHPEQVRRNAPLRTASRGLVRGVGCLRILLGLVQRVRRLGCGGRAAAAAGSGKDRLRVA